MSNIDEKYYDLFFFKQPHTGRKQKDNYPLRLYMLLLTKPEGMTPTQIADSFQHNMKEYSLLKEQNKVARLCKQLYLQEFLKPIRPTGKIDERNQYYTVEQINFFRVIQGFKVRTYSPQTALDVFISILKKNPFYYDTRFTILSDYFLASLSALCTINNDKNIRAYDEAIKRIIHFVNRTYQTNIVFDKIEYERLEKFNVTKSYTFLYFYMDYMIKLYENKYETTLSPEDRADVRFTLDNWNLIKQSRPQISQSFAQYKH